MLRLNLPHLEAKVIVKNEKHLIYDPLRCKYVTLTPEEWVRQHFTAYLIREKEYPSSFLGNEISIKLNGTTKRCDTVVYDPHLNPLLIIEYKAPSVQIDQTVMDQIVRYNMTLKVKYLIVSNGLHHYCCQIDYEKNSYSFLKTIPAYTDLR